MRNEDLVHFVRPIPPESGGRQRSDGSRPGPVLRMAVEGESEQPDAAARRAVATENLLSINISRAEVADDFAGAVAASLQGGRAALLTPERRRQLVAGAVKAGMRPFECHLVVAAVQDAARHGEIATGGTGNTESAGGAYQRRNEKDARIAIIMILCVAALTIAVFASLVAWVLSPGSETLPR